MSICRTLPVHRGVMSDVTIGVHQDAEVGQRSRQISQRPEGLGSHFWKQVRYIYSAERIGRVTCELHRSMGMTGVAILVPCQRRHSVSSDVVLLLPVLPATALRQTSTLSSEGDECGCRVTGSTHPGHVWSSDSGVSVSSGVTIGRSIPGVHDIRTRVPEEALAHRRQIASEAPEALGC